MNELMDLAAGVPRSMIDTYGDHEHDHEQVAIMDRHTVLREAAACAVPGSVGVLVARAKVVDVEVPAGAGAGQGVRPVARREPGEVGARWQAVIASTGPTSAQHITRSRCHTHYTGR